MKYLFFDLDGTLKGKSREFTPANKQALYDAQKAGHKVFLCSGRCPEYLKRTICQEFPFDGVVGCAGGSVLIGDQCIFENAIPDEILVPLIDFFRAEGIDYSLETTEGNFQTPGTMAVFHDLYKHIAAVDPKAAEASKREERCGANRPIAEYDPARRTVQKICFTIYSRESHERFAKFVDPYFNRVYFADEDDMIFGEIILKTVTKAQGIEQVLKYFGAEVSDSVGFGDSMNDYQMMEYAGTRVVYEKAPEELLALGDYFFRDPDQDGIAQVMREAGLIG